jgi:hypothetical protein
MSWEDVQNIVMVVSSATLHLSSATLLFAALLLVVVVVGVVVGVASLLCVVVQYEVSSICSGGKHGAQVSDGGCSLYSSTD